MPKVLSIIIVNTNTRDWLDACLASLFAQNIFDQLQVIVIENASKDGSRELLQEKYSWANAVFLDTTIGFGPANNIGSKEAMADTLLFLNQDTVVKPESLGRILSELSERPDWGVAGGTVYDGDGDLERSTGSYPTFTSLVLNRVLASIGWLRPLFGSFSFQHWKGYERSRTVGWVTGAYLWVRKDVFEELGGFDEKIYLYCEDVDLCYRATKLGKECLYFPTGPIVHYRNKAPVPRERKQMQREYLNYFGQKHYHSPRFWITRLTMWLMAPKPSN
jgi:hypothetical protein